jgi:hypothetical protein
LLKTNARASGRGLQPVRRQFQAPLVQLNRHPVLPQGDMDVAEQDGQLPSLGWRVMRLAVLFRSLRSPLAPARCGVLAADRVIIGDTGEVSRTV